MVRTICHLDLDAFYCAVESRRDPSLKGVPFAVAQHSQNVASDLTIPFATDRRFTQQPGGIIALSYEAKARKVKRGMTCQEAREVCPEMQFVRVPVKWGKADVQPYRDAGSEVVQVLQTFAPVERVSVDEVYIDLTDYVAREIESMADVAGQNEPIEALPAGVVRHGEEFDVAARVALRIKEQVWLKCGFSCSIGIAPTKCVAKTCSALYKPSMVSTCSSTHVHALLSALPIKKLRGLGGKLGDEVVDAFSIEKTEELQNISMDELTEALGDRHANIVYRAARGLDESEVVSRVVSKSLAVAKNFRALNANQLRNWVAILCAQLLDRATEDTQNNARTPTLLTISFAWPGGKKSKSMPWSSANLQDAVLSVVADHQLTSLTLAVSKFVQQRPRGQRISDFFKKLPKKTKNTNTATVDGTTAEPASSSGSGRTPQWFHALQAASQARAPNGGHVVHGESTPSQVPQCAHQPTPVSAPRSSSLSSSRVPQWFLSLRAATSAQAAPASAACREHVKLEERCEAPTTDMLSMNGPEHCGTSTPAVRVDSLANVTWASCDGSVLLEERASCGTDPAHGAVTAQSNGSKRDTHQQYQTTNSSQQDLDTFATTCGHRLQGTSNTMPHQTHGVVPVSTRSSCFNADTNQQYQTTSCAQQGLGTFATAGDHRLQRITYTMPHQTSAGLFMNALSSLSNSSYSQAHESRDAATPHGLSLREGHPTHQASRVSSSNTPCADASIIPQRPHTAPAHASHEFSSTNVPDSSTSAAPIAETLCMHNHERRTVEASASCATVMRVQDGDATEHLNAPRSSNALGNLNASRSMNSNVLLPGYPNVPESAAQHNRDTPSCGSSGILLSNTQGPSNNGTQDPNPSTSMSSDVFLPKYPNVPESTAQHTLNSASSGNRSGVLLPNILGPHNTATQNPNPSRSSNSSFVFPDNTQMPKNTASHNLNASRTISGTYVPSQNSLVSGGAATHIPHTRRDTDNNALTTQAQGCTAPNWDATMTSNRDVRLIHNLHAGGSISSATPYRSLGVQENGKICISNTPAGCDSSTFLLQNPTVCESNATQNPNMLSSNNRSVCPVENHQASRSLAPLRPDVPRSSTSSFFPLHTEETLNSTMKKSNKPNNSNSSDYAFHNPQMSRSDATQIPNAPSCNIRTVFAAQDSDALGTTGTPHPNVPCSSSNGSTSLVQNPQTSCRIALSLNGPAAPSLNGTTAPYLSQTAASSTMYNASASSVISEVKADERSGTRHVVGEHIGEVLHENSLPGHTETTHVTTQSRHCASRLVPDAAATSLDCASPTAASGHASQASASTIVLDSRTGASSKQDCEASREIDLTSSAKPVRRARIASSRATHHSKAVPRHSETSAEKTAARPTKSPPVGRARKPRSGAAKRPLECPMPALTKGSKKQKKHQHPVLIDDIEWSSDER